MATVGQTPIAPPTSMKMAISMSGTARKMRKMKAGKTDFRGGSGKFEHRAAPALTMKIGYGTGFAHMAPVVKRLPMP